MLQWTFHFKDLIAIFLGLQTLWPYSLTEPDFFGFRVFLGACFLQNEVRDPPFFTFLTQLTHHLTVVNVSEKNQYWKIFARTSLIEGVHLIWGPLNTCFTLPCSCGWWNNRKISIALSYVTRFFELHFSKNKLSPAIANSTSNKLIAVR